MSYSSIKLAISVNQCELYAEGKTEEGGAPLEDGAPYVNEGIRAGATRGALRLPLQDGSSRSVEKSGDPGDRHSQGDLFLSHIATYFCWFPDPFFF